MADCSKTEVFLSEFDRMCKEYKNEPCTGCPARALANAIGEKDCRKATLQMPVNLVISAVQRWSDEHPLPKPKTYADVFFERFPNNTILTRFPKDFLWMNSLCRDVYFGGVDCCPGRDCKSCWNEPYPEQEVQEK